MSRTASSAATTATSVATAAMAARRCRSRAGGRSSSAASAAPISAPHVPYRSRGLLGHRLADHCVDRVGQLGATLRSARRLLLQVRPGQREPRAARKRRFARQALEEKTAERVDVRAAVDRAAFDLLGSEIRGRADAPSPGAAVFVESSRQSEVGEIDMLAAVEQHVGGLDVAMDETVRVGGIQRVRDPAADGQRARLVEPPSLAQERAQVRPFDIAHREVETTVDVAGVVDRHDVRVLERHGELRLAREALAESLDPAPARAPSASGRQSVSSASRRRGRRRPSRRGRSARRVGTRRTRSRSGSLPERSRASVLLPFNLTPLARSNG